MPLLFYFLEKSFKNFFIPILGAILILLSILKLLLILELLRTNKSSFTPERMVKDGLNTIQESYQYTICDRCFRTNRGLSQHLLSCQSKNVNSTVSDTITATDENTLLDN